MKPSQHMPQPNQKPISHAPGVNDYFLEMKDDEKTEMHYGVILQEVWALKSETIKKMFKTDGPERRTTMMYLDIPYLHLHSRQGVAFIKALSKSNAAIFRNTSIQILVNYHWRRVKVFIWWLIMFPYVI